MDQNFPRTDAWVSCDECLKWRRIPFSLVDSIGQAHFRWVCKDNLDKSYADCTTPQEKSNAEINAELGIAGADEDTSSVVSSEKELLNLVTTVPKEHEFIAISSNQFLHRSHKSQFIDEVMVCHCKPLQNGELGCGHQCLNRMLSIECVQGTCPCGDLCSNQQFQKRNYAKMGWDRCGKKGFGVRLQEDIPKGKFLIEYVGEVIDMNDYALRQREYSSRGHKHFYFMALNGSEVIDACRKGNLGRFVNHSCDPNCRTEKWLVNGEICIGLFALRDIKKGEELTFDYNFVRVVGGAAKKCYCFSPQCRGYIGSDPVNNDAIQQVDSDTEFPEPVILDDAEVDDVTVAVHENISTTFPETETDAHASNGNIDILSSKASDALFEASKERNDSTELQSCLSLSQSTLDSDNSTKNCMPSSELMGIHSQADVTSKQRSLPDQGRFPEHVKIKKQNTQRGLAVHISISKPRDEHVNTDAAICERKRHLDKSHLQSRNSPAAVSTKVQTISNKSHTFSFKNQRLKAGTSILHSETVQDALNELLNHDGGINKQKDAPKGYLKLLVLTAASGSIGNSSTIQSNRDLSMILDALLKTKSQVVLTDIVNKNGLQMLHNIMKKYRSDFKKIPILRKLLKVLEYLAAKKLLPSDYINGGPLCHGMESFKESVLSLTTHVDKEVQQIARNFRDRWFQRPFKRPRYMDGNEWKSESPNCSGTRLPLEPNAHPHVGDRCQAVDHFAHSRRATTPYDTSIDSMAEDRVSRFEGCRDATCATDSNNGLEADADVPPGFSSPSRQLPTSSYASPNTRALTPLPPNPDIVDGFPQFRSQRPVAHGIPVLAMHPLHVPGSEAISIGIPFHPFPPVPPSLSPDLTPHPVNPHTPKDVQKNEEWRDLGHAETKSMSVKRARKSRWDT